MESSDIRDGAASAAPGEEPGRQPAHGLRTVACASRPAFAVTRLAPHDADAYGDLALPGLRSMLTRISDDCPVVAVGANRFGRGIGVAVARLSTNGASGRVLWLFVRPGYRRIGMGTALLAALEELLTERGCRRISLTYPVGGPASTGLEAVTRRSGWDPPHRSREPHLATGQDTWEAGKNLYPGGRTPVDRT